MVPCSGLPAAKRSAGVSSPWSAELRTIWVSGSLIRSSTWRSSSVSAPCISSSICLPSSPERSRTMRGSFCQALPIGCIRVFMTPSCSSAVTLESRCSGTLNSVSSWRLRDLEQLVARQHQLRHHGHQMFERVDIDADRLVGDPVGVRGFRLGKGFFRSRLCGGLRSRGFLHGRDRRRDFGRGFAKRPLQIVERDFAGPQRALQHLEGQRALLDLRLGGQLPPSPPCRARPSHAAHRSGRHRRPRARFASIQVLREFP